MLIFSACIPSFSSTPSSQNDYHFIMMRHARAPGSGDPKNFKIRDCSTQRNLSKDGIEQAKRIGRTLPEKITVYSSQWCRALDTARNLNRGDVIELDLLNSFFSDRSRESIQTLNLKNWLEKEISKKKLFILVTHQVNITALTGIFPQEGEVLYLKLNDQGKIEVANRVSNSD